MGKSVIQNMNFEEVSFSNFDPIEVFCNQVAAEVLVPQNELLKMVKLKVSNKILSEACAYFRVSPEVIMRRLLTLNKISQQEYQTFRKDQQEKYKDNIQEPKGFPHYHTRLLNAYGEFFATYRFHCLL